MEGWYTGHDHVIKASDIELFQTDGTPLSDLGNDLFLNNMQTAFDYFSTFKVFLIHLSIFCHFRGVCLYYITSL